MTLAQTPSYMQAHTNYSMPDHLIQPYVIYPYSVGGWHPPKENENGLTSSCIWNCLIDASLIYKNCRVLMECIAMSWLLISFHMNIRPCH